MRKVRLMDGRKPAGMKLTMGDPLRGTLTAHRIDCANALVRQLQWLVRRQLHRRRGEARSGPR
jgi:hypothetical protein